MLPVRILQNQLLLPEINIFYLHFCLKQLKTGKNGIAIKKQLSRLWIFMLLVRKFGNQLLFPEF